MRTALTASIALSTALFSSAAHSDWSSDFEVGAEYSGVVDIGRLGVRKQVVLPENSGNWRFLGSETRPDRLAHAITSTVRVDAKFGNLVFASIGTKQDVRALLNVDASVEPITNAILPTICVPRDGVAHQNLYPSFNSNRKPKCLTIEKIDAESLGTPERHALKAHGLRFPGRGLIRLTMATSDNRYGTLSLIFTTEAPNFGLNDYIEAVKAWGDRYVTQQIEDLLSRSLDEPRFNDPYPISTVGDAVAPTGDQTTFDSAGKKQTENATDDVLSLLEKLKALKEKGVITEQEFDVKKKELLNRL